MQDSRFNSKHKRSVPQIFIAENWLGGNDAIQALEDEGKLDKIIQDAGIEEGSLVTL